MRRTFAVVTKGGTVLNSIHKASSFSSFPTFQFSGNSSVCLSISFSGRNHNDGHVFYTHNSVMFSVSLQGSVQHEVQVLSAKSLLSQNTNIFRKKQNYIESKRTSSEDERFPACLSILMI